MTKSRNKHIAPFAAVLAAALLAAGSGYAASRIHHTTSSSSSSGLSSGTPISSTSGAAGHDAGPGPGDRRGGPGHKLTAAAGYLGVTEAQLLTSLQSGKTLAQVADATSGKSAAGLIAALVAAEKTEIATAVTAGTITQAQADQITSTLTARFTALVNNTLPDHGPGGPGGFGSHGPGGDDFTAATTYLGITETALSTQLQAGKTLAQVADATSGKSAAGLIDTLVAHETTELDAAVTAGRITKAQRDQMVTTLKARFTAMANGTRPAHDGHFGGHDGPPPPGTAPSSGFKPSGTHI